MNTQLLRLLSISALVSASALSTYAQELDARSSLDYGLPVNPGESAQNPGANGIEKAIGTGQNDEYETIGMRQDRMAQGASYGAITQKGAIEIALDTVAATQSVNQMLDVNLTVSTIQSAGFASRDTIARYVAARRNAGDEALRNMMRNGSDRLTGESRAHALQAARRGDRELLSSLQATTNASASDWIQTRSALASSYERFANAVIHVENVSTGRVASTASVPTGVLVASAR